MILTLYHGTSSSNFKKIKTEGIKPRGRKKPNSENMKSRNNLVYLSNCYACYYARNASNKKGDKLIILKIQIDTNKIKLYPDEEFIYHLLKFNKADNKEMAEELYRLINPKKLSKELSKMIKRLPTWKDSLKFMGTVSADFIPPEAIVEYAKVEVMESLMLCDPCISPLNYRIMNITYKKGLENLKYKKLIS